MSLLETIKITPPGLIALRYPDGREVTYGELGVAAERAGECRLPDGPVGLCLADPLAVIAWSAGLLSRGKPVFLTHPDLPAAELGALAAHERAAAVITDAARVPREFTPLPYSDRMAGEVIGVRSGSASGQPGLHLYTSGSSGRRKGAIRSEPSLIAEGIAVAARLGYTRKTVVFCAVPLCHAYGFADGVLAVLAAGACLTVGRPASRGRLGMALRATGADVLVGVPTLYDAWTTGMRAETEHGLRLSVSAGAPLPDAVGARFAEYWGVAVSQQYGMTECGAISIDLAGGCSSRVGRPFPGVEVRLEAGEIVVDSPFTAEGYVAGVERLMPRNPFTADGLLTGDLGRFDDRGGLHLTGRREEVINVHGAKVDAVDVEQVLCLHPAVAEAAVAGVPTRHGDRWVAAFVVRGGDVSEADLVTFCRSRLAGFQIPRRIVMVPELPRTALGKIRRAALVDLLT